MLLALNNKETLCLLTIKLYTSLWLQMVNRAHTVALVLLSEHPECFSGLCLTFNHSHKHLHYGWWKLIKASTCAQFLHYRVRLINTIFGVITFSKTERKRKNMFLGIPIHWLCPNWSCTGHMEVHSLPVFSLTNFLGCEFRKSSYSVECRGNRFWNNVYSELFTQNNTPIMMSISGGTDKVLLKTLKGYLARKTLVDRCWYQLFLTVYINSLFIHLLGDWPGLGSGLVFVPLSAGAHGVCSTTILETAREEMAPSTGEMQEQHQQDRLLHKCVCSGCWFWYHYAKNIVYLCWYVCQQFPPTRYIAKKGADLLDGLVYM